MRLEIVERRFRLSILDEAGISSSPLRVMDGSEVQLRLRLLSVSSSLGTPSLGEGEMLTVLLTFIDPTGTGTGILLVPAQVTFSRGSTETEVDLLLRGRSSDATLTAKAVEFGLRNVSVESTAVAVEVISRRFQLSLSPAGARFSRTVRPNEVIPDFTATQSVRSTITMAEATTIRSLSVRVEIRHSHIGDLRVLLVSPEGAVVALHNETGGSAENLFETYTSLDHTDLAALVGVPAQGEWILTVGDYLSGDTGTLEAWSLQTNTGAQVTAGGSVPVVATLSGLDTPFGASRLFADERLAVNWTYPDGAGVTLSPVVFDVASRASSVEVAATLTATLNATAGVGMLESNGNGLKNAEVEPATLSVEIVPRRFRLSLSGAPFGDAPFVGASSPVALIPDAQSSLRSAIAVPEITIESLVVQVAIRHRDISDLMVVLVPPGVAEEEGVLLHDRAATFEKTYTSVRSSLADLVGREFPAGDWVLRVEDFQSRNVGVLNAWYLEINTGAQVIAGESVPVVATLSGVDTPFGASRLFAGETLTVDWTYTDGADVTLRLVVFQVASPRSSVEVASMLSATSAATAGVLEATFSATLLNAKIDPALVPVQPIRRFRLTFVPATTARVLAGGTTVVEVVLENANLLREGEVVRVSLSTEIVIVVPSTPFAPSALMLTRAMPRATFTIEARHAADPPLGMVVASGEVLLLADGTAVAHTEVVSVTLSVEVAPRMFRLFVAGDVAEPGSERVVAGGSTEVVVGIVGVDTPLGPSRLFASETLQVDFVYTGGEGVTLSLVSLGAGNTSRVGNDALLALATVYADEGATSGVLQLSGNGLKNAEVEPASIPVEIVPRAFTLVLDVPSVSVLAGGTTEVVVMLADPLSLGAGESVQVLLSTQTPGIVVTGGLDERTLTVAESSTSFIIEAAHDAPTSGTMTASGEVVSGGSIVVNTEVVSVTLSVEVAPRMFRLFVARDVAEPSSERVVAGGSTEVVVGITGVDTPLGPSRLDASETLQVGFVYMDGEGVTLSPLSLGADNTSRVGNDALLALADGKRRRGRDVGGAAVDRQRSDKRGCCAGGVED